MRQKSCKSGNIRRKCVAPVISTKKEYPVNPIDYLYEREITRIFRFILTHPDMDHMDGIKEFFAHLSPINFWDTDNNCEKEFETDEYGRYNPDDWYFYKSLRDKTATNSPTRLTLFSGKKGS
jgi:competence protein ComEC